MTSPDPVNTPTAELMIVAWCDHVLDGNAQRIRHKPLPGDLGLVLARDAADALSSARERVEALEAALEAAEAENQDLHENLIDLHENLIQVMQERNARTFALQCVRSHAIKNGEMDTAQNITEWLTGAGLELGPQHWLINPDHDGATP